jgi:3-methyladenine DNA glycosylase/8-oxoguanine DNA glycosylase
MPPISETPDHGLAYNIRLCTGKVLRSPTLFEDVVRTLLTTNPFWKYTLRMYRMLASRYGDPIPSEPELHAFPTPEHLAGAVEPESTQKVGEWEKPVYPLLEMI